MTLDSENYIASSKFFYYYNDFPYYIARKGIQLDNSEQIEKEFTQTRSFLIEFPDDESQKSFCIEQNLMGTQNEVSGADLEKYPGLETDKNDQNDQNNKEVQLVLQFKHTPTIWVLGSYKWIQTISQDYIQHIYLDVPCFLSVNSVRSQFNLDEIHQSLFKITGKGIKVGIIDSGIDASHPALREKICASINLTDEHDGDYNGHGTFLAGIIAANSPDSTGIVTQGIAPDAKLIDYKIFNQKGAANLSDLITIMDMICDRQQQENIPDILLFGGTLAGRYENSLIDSYLKQLYEMNVVLISPTGNFGPDPGIICAPSSYSHVISVGAIDSQQKVTFFSGRDSFSVKNFKPDIVLPGKDIISLKSLNGSIGEYLSSDVNAIILSGTSISAAVAAGFMALLKSALPSKNPSELLQLLSSSMLPSNQENYVSGKGIPHIETIMENNKILLAAPQTPNQVWWNSLKTGLNWGLVILIFFYILHYFLNYSI